MITRFLIALTLTFFCTTIMAEQVAKVSLDRAWGLLIGDELQLQIELPIDVGDLDPTSLPQIDKRYGTWLYLKALTRTDNMLWLSYQIVNVPADTIEVYTPTFNVRQLDDQWITVPEVAFTIGTLLTEQTGGSVNNSVLKADRKPTLISTSETKSRLKIASLLTIIFSLILLAWHIGWRPKNRQPFAQAVHELARLKWSRSMQQDQPSRILHTAFNNTSGTVVVHSELVQLLSQAPWLQPLEQEISQFYLSSANHFFNRNIEQEPDFDAVIKLAKACRSKEKLA
ncbi:MAG: hypothetical protein ACKE9I_00745 [Methylophagaceae bacterium]